MITSRGPLTLQALFDAALDLPPEARAAFLDQHPADTELRQQVRRLLDADRRAEARCFLAEPLIERPSSQLRPGERLGPYRIEELVAEGGMGVVYAGRRDDGSTVERRVAIKLLRPGADLDQAYPRLIREQRLLARLEHPNIARLYDGGVTADGRPYMVMELVDGVPIDTFVRTHGLGTEAILRLILGVCGALAHAHRHLVIHRDLKPSNVLVTADGEPMLIDFGIAKPLFSDPNPIHTRSGARLLTPAYASPEQVRGGPLSTATDVYGLGVLLFELLTGRLPFEEDSWRGLEHAICEQPPPLPSRVAVRPNRLAGNLDNIVRMALRKEPELRYGSIQQLAEDLEHHLEHRPVRARPSTWRYRTSRFVLRHRAVSSVAGVALLLLTVAALLNWRSAERARLEASHREAALSFVVDLFAEADPTVRSAAPRSARDILDRGAERLTGPIADRPEIRTTTVLKIAEAYANLAAFDRAATLLTRELDQQDRDPGPTPPGTRLAVLEQLARARRGQGDVARAADLFEEVVVGWRRLGRGSRSSLAEALLGWSRALRQLDRTEEAEATAREALALHREVFSDDDPRVTESLHGLAHSLHSQGRYEESLELFRESLRRLRQRLGPDHFEVALTEASIGAALSAMGELVEADKILRSAVASWRRMDLGDHPDLASTLGTLSQLQRELDHDAEAEVLARQSLAMFERILGVDHVKLLPSLNRLAGIHRERGELDTAETLYRRALGLALDGYPAPHGQVAKAWFHLGQVAFERRELHLAEARARRSIEILEAVGPPNSIRVTYPQVLLGRILADREELTDAVAIWRRALDRRRQFLPADHSELREIESLLEATADRTTEPFSPKAASTDLGPRRALRGAGLDAAVHDEPTG